MCTCFSQKIKIIISRVVGVFSVLMFILGVLLIIQYEEQKSYKNSETGVGFPIDLATFAAALPFVAYPLIITSILGCITVVVKHPATAIPFGAATFLLGFGALGAGSIFLFLISMLNPEM